MLDFIIVCHKVSIAIRLALVQLNVHDTPSFTFNKIILGLCFSSADIQFISFLNIHLYYQSNISYSLNVSSISIIFAIDLL